ncbi:MAG: DNA polymerase IV [Candidatus Paceibacterota bacterium]|jgi:DNA polymerase-4/DNA polymerase V
MSNSKKTKTIFHMDGDAFFVGVEVAKNPKLKGLPVVTGEERGIVSALSYEAKALGIIRGMPIFRVKCDFPNVIILPGDYKSYARYSSMMFDIVRRYADDVEEYSIDECFADLTGLELPLKMTYLEMAERIKREVNDELRLSVSIGLAPTKVLAKVASKWVKPNGLTVVSVESAPDFLRKTPIGKIWGIGPKTSELLKMKGIDTAFDFVQKDLSWIRNNLSKPYEVIWRELRGEYIMELDPRPKTVYSSIQKTRSFHPSTNDKTFLLSQFSKNMEEACAKARHYKLVPRKIAFFLKTKDFVYVTCSMPLASPTNAPEILISLVRARFPEIHAKSVLYRSTGVVLQDLVPNSCIQEDLFGGAKKVNKFEVIHNQIDSLEDKFGKRAVYLASTHDALKRKVTGTDAGDIDRNLLFL